MENECSTTPQQPDAVPMVVDGDEAPAQSMETTLTPENDGSNDSDSEADNSQESMQQLYEMRINNVLCDAVIRLDDESRYNVHRNILTACSTRFR